jgi:hypothetical protein
VTAWFGMSFQRHNTWFEQSRAWMDYLRRCHYMLQQGDPSADLLYFIGEDVPRMTGALEPAVPQGYDFDFVNTEVIMNRLSVVDGLLTLPEGLQYRALVLPPNPTMRPEVLRRIGQLVREGATIVGTPPVRSPSLSGYLAADAEVKGLAEEIWGRCDGKEVRENSYGKGVVFRGLPLEEVLAKLGTGPDLIYPDPEIKWTHRRAPDLDIYFISNQSDKPVQTEIAFRVGAKIPEFWCPKSGSIRRIARFRTEGGLTHVPVSLGESGSLFVVFRSPGTGDHFIDCLPERRDGPAGSDPMLCYAADGNPMLMTRSEGAWRLRRADGKDILVESGSLPASFELNGNWTLSFPSGWDCPESLALDRLVDWRELPGEGMRHFSGTARYQTKVKIPEHYIVAGDRLLLELGAVENLAEISVNDQPMGVIWCPPYEVDITEAVRAGENELAVSVTNLWWNRLVGDAKYPGGFPDGLGGAAGTGPRTFGTHVAWSAADSLLPSGLIGPVQIRIQRHIPVR